jgi:modulator of FtsH protease HflC
MKILNALAILVILGLVILWSFTFTVHEREKAIKFTLGKIERSDYTPGLYFKLPIYNNVKKFSGQIQTLDERPERYLTLEKKNVLVDSFVKWKINNVVKFYTATNGNFLRANSRLSQIIKNGLRSAFGQRTIQEAISGERTEIMKNITDYADKNTEEFGIQIVDVRIKRVDLPQDISDSVYERMNSERSRIAKELRSQGEEEAEKIQAEADRQRTVLLANATKEAEELRGQGDAEATDIYARIYSADPQFYDFYRSMQAYQHSFKGKNNTMVLSPDSEFFNHFGKGAH